MNGGGGSVFYLQPRVGKGGQEFYLMKFRSMVSGADRHGLLTVPEDPRVTFVGRFLRKHKLDELPQLINVLKGDIRLVGSRPEMKRYVDMFRGEYNVLLQDPPGITDPASLVYRHEEKMLKTECLEEHYVAQILPQKLRLSLEYARRRTFFSDVKIVFQTLQGGNVAECYSSSTNPDDSTEKLLPTRFAKIHMINGVHFNSAEFAQKVRALVRSAHRGSQHEIYQIFDELDIGFQTPIFNHVGQNQTREDGLRDLGQATYSRYSSSRGDVETASTCFPG
jgi:lipopolysaccharide/colanic/teichoic acid biosynthesis glycosyltransferase